jgi:hypothetical protein
VNIAERLEADGTRQVPVSNGSIVEVLGVDRVPLQPIVLGEFHVRVQCVQQNALAAHETRPVRKTARVGVNSFASGGWSWTGFARLGMLGLRTVESSSCI